VRTRRQFRRGSLRNSSGVLGCVVHMLADATRRCRLGFAPVDANSLSGHSRSQALVRGPRRIDVFHQAKAHCPCALWVPALGEWAPALDQVVHYAVSKTRSEEGLMDMWDTNFVSTPVVPAASGLVGFGSPDTMAVVVPLTGGAEVTCAGGGDAAWGSTGSGGDQGRGVV
jgi:hypothetical protein